MDSLDDVGASESTNRAVKVGWQARHCGMQMENSVQIKTLITLPSGHGIELGFFLWLQNHGPHPRETGFGEVDVTTGNNPTGVPDVRALILVPGGKVHQKLIQFRV